MKIIRIRQEQSTQLGGLNIHVQPKGIINYTIKDHFRNPHDKKVKRELCLVRPCQYISQSINYLHKKSILCLCIENPHDMIRDFE